VLYSWISNALLGCFRCFYICLLSLMYRHLPDRPFFVPLYGRLKFSPRKRTKQGLQRAWGPISCPAPNHAKATPVTARPQNATTCLLPYSHEQKLRISRRKHLRSLGNETDCKYLSPNSLLQLAFQFQAFEKWWWCLHVSETV